MNIYLNKKLLIIGFQLNGVRYYFITNYQVKGKVKKIKKNIASTVANGGHKKIAISKVIFRPFG